MVSSAGLAALSPVLPSGTPGTEPCPHRLAGCNSAELGRRLMFVDGAVYEAQAAQKQLGPADAIGKSAGSSCPLGRLALGRICVGPGS